MRLPLTTFASGFFNSGGIGPIGMAVNCADQVIVNDVENSTNYVFHDVDGQTVGTAITSTPCNAFPAAMREIAGAGGTVYTRLQRSKCRQFIILNNDGTANADAPYQLITGH